MSNQIITPLATAIVQKVKDAGEKVYVWPPRELDKVPAAVVELPVITRTGVDQAEDHLGQTDWTLTYPVIFYFDLAKAEVDADKAADVVEAFVLAIDADQSLGGLCQEAKVIAVEEPEFGVEINSRTLIRWPTRVEVLKFV